MDTEKSRYESLTQIVDQLYESKKRLRREITTKREEVTQLAGQLRDWSFTHTFPVLERDINQMIATWSPTAPLERLQVQLAAIKDKIKTLDAEITKIGDRQQNLLQWPDRHSRKKLTDKIALFLRDVTNVPLASLDNVIGTVIPDIYNKMDEVVKRFQEERGKVEANRLKAQELKKRIGQYTAYVDRFNLKQICTDASNIANQVLHSPNDATPEADTRQIDEANRRLDQCLAQFEQEKVSFEQLRGKLESKRVSIWQEDYDPLIAILEECPYNDPSPLSELERRYHALLNVKERDITNVTSLYSPKIRNYFNSEIRGIRDNHCSRHELDNLNRRMAQKRSEEDRKRRILICKIVGAVVGVLLLLYVLFVLEWWPYFLSVAIIVATIAAIVGLIHYFKN